MKIRGNDSAFMEEYRAARMESAEATRLKMILTMMPRYVLEVAFVAAIAALVAVAFIQGRGGGVRLARPARDGRLPRAAVHGRAHGHHQ